MIIMAQSEKNDIPYYATISIALATFFSAGEEVLFPFHGDWNTVVLKSASLLALTPLKGATPRS